MLKYYKGVHFLIFSLFMLPILNGIDLELQQNSYFSMLVYMTTLHNIVVTGKETLAPFCSVTMSYRGRTIDISACSIDRRRRQIN